MTAAEVPLLCPYMEDGQDGPICHRPRTERLCERHMPPMFSVCSGAGEECTGEGVRLCPERGCRMPLCGRCHHLGPGVHGPYRTENDAETPRQEGEPETGGTPGAVESIRAEMEETVLLSLRRARRETLDEHDTAARVVRDLGITTLLGVLQGLGRADTGGTG